MEPNSIASAPNPIGGIIPETQVSLEAYVHASSLLDPSILNHSIRVYLYATALAKHETSAFFADASKHDLLLTACLFHDIGTTTTYDGEARFEIEGADAAVKFLSQYKHFSDQDKFDVWVAIALHTSPQLAERIGILARMLRIAVITDFGRDTLENSVLEHMRGGLEKDFQRCGIEKVLGDKVVEQACRQPGKAPMVSWPGVLYKAHLAEPEWNGVNKAF